MVSSYDVNKNVKEMVIPRLTRCPTPVKLQGVLATFSKPFTIPLVTTPLAAARLATRRDPRLIRIGDRAVEAFLAGLAGLFHTDPTIKPILP